MVVHNQFRNVFAAIAVPLFLTGCFMRPPVTTHTSSAAQTSLLDHPAAERSVPEVPFQISVVDEFHNGKDLTLQASVISKIPWDPRRVAVRLSGMDDGELINQVNATIAELLPLVARIGPVPPLQEVQFPLGMAASGISDYQLELLWGDDAREVLEASASRIATIENLTVNAVSDVCEEPPCPESFQLSGDLVNHGVVPLEYTALGVGFIWAADGEERSDGHRIPEREQKVTLRNLGIAPGHSKPLRLTLNRNVPRREGGKYLPIIRILGMNLPGMTGKDARS